MSRAGSLSRKEHPLEALITECVHEIDMGWPAGWCSCHHPAPVKKTSKPKPTELERLIDKLFDQQAPVDRDITTAEQVAAGVLCGDCLTPIAPIGCNCARQRAHHDDWQIEAVGDDGYRRIIAGPGQFDQALAFLDSDEAIAAFGPRACAGMAFATATRSGRRAGLTDDERQQDRLTVIDQFAVDPRWKKLTRQEANHLPV